MESFCHERHFTHFKWGFTCPWLLLHLQNIKPLHAYHVSCQIPMLMKGVISHQSQNCYFPSQCAKEKGPNNNPEIHHVQTQFCFYTTRIADWHIYLRIRYISSRIRRPTNATQMWQVISFLFFNPLKQRSPKQTKWVFTNRNPKKENLIFYFWIHNQEAYYNLILSLLRSIHLRDFTFQKLEFRGCQPQGSRNLVWLLHVCSGQQANYKNILNRHDDMMTLSWFEWSNNTCHEKQEISILMIKKAWTRLKSSS